MSDSMCRLPADAVGTPYSYETQTCFLRCVGDGEDAVWYLLLSGSDARLGSDVATSPKRGFSCRVAGEEDVEVHSERNGDALRAIFDVLFVDLQVGFGVRVRVVCLV